MRFESGRVVLRRDWQTHRRSGRRGARATRRAAAQPPCRGRHSRRICRPCTSMRPDRAAIRQPFRERGEVHAGRDARCASRRAPTSDFVRVIVEDDGPGLPAGDPDRLFDKFQRGRDESDGHRRRPRSRDLPRHRAGARRRHPRQRPRRWRGALRIHAADRRSPRRDTGDAPDSASSRTSRVSAESSALMLQSEQLPGIEADTAARAEIEARTHRPICCWSISDCRTGTAWT